MRKKIQIAAVLLAICATSHCAFGQGSPGPIGATPVESGKGSLVVQVKEMNGLPINQAVLTLYTDMLFSTGDNPVRQGDSFVFQNVVPGRYIIEATMVGFEQVRRTVELTNASQTEAIVLFMKPVGTGSSNAYASETSVFTPKSQKETQSALRDLNSKKYASAEKHLTVALRESPKNATIHYLLGMTCIWTGRESEAKPYLEQALSLDPKHVESLLALGNIRFKAGDNAGTIELLDRALLISPSSWQAHLMLAQANLRVNNFTSAREHAERAYELGREKAVGAQLLLAQALAGLGENRKSATVLRNYLEEHPSDPNAEKIREWIKELERIEENSNHQIPIATTPLPNVAVVAPAVAVLAPPTTRNMWTPPDSDATLPLIIPGKVCSLPEVLLGAANSAEQLVTHLEQFSALEHYESVEIGVHGELLDPISAAFDYVAEIHRVRPGILSMEEVREQNHVVTSLPERIQDLGSPAVALIFHPQYQEDFEMKCEGMGEWNGQPTWLVHFRQRADRPARLRDFVSGHMDYAMRLRGRAWILPDTFQIVHLETDLIEPISAVHLQREHMSVDYKLVPFPKYKIDLWLPQQVDLYYDFRGHFYHHYHSFSDFLLFSVNTTPKISRPREKDPPN